MLLPNDELTALAATGDGLDRGTLLALNEATWNQPTVLATLALFLLGMVVGGVLLGIALWRGDAAPRWAALALVVGSVLHLAPGFAHNVVAALSWALTTCAYAAVSVALLRAADRGRAEPAVR